MNAKSSRIILYPLASEAEADLLARQLADIGYTQVVRPKGPGHLKKLLGDGSFSCLVLLLTDSAISQNEHLDVLRIVKTLPVIGLLSEDCARFDLPSVRACHEIAIWPCSREELAYRIGRHITSFQNQPDSEHNYFVKMNILGNSPDFLKLLEKVGKILKCDAPVFIDGETGTGKELIARAIHYLGERKDQPFIAVNCGAFPDELIGNELFGHHKGAYTDARESTDGLIAQAEGGTLFLDEIETLSPKGQVTLLRFLENMSYRSLGSDSAKVANIRIIAATNESICELVEEGSFRKDLYYRINVMNIVMPPLRERAGDINLLADHFISRYQIQYNRPETELHPDTRSALKYYDWPGNVRELENVLHREFLLADGKYISIDEIEAMTRERRKVYGDRRFTKIFAQPLVKAKNYLVTEFEKQYLSSALERANGNISEAARLAGKERRSFTRLLQKYNLSGARHKVSQ